MPWCLRLRTRVSVGREATEARAGAEGAATRACPCRPVILWPRARARLRMTGKRAKHEGMMRIAFALAAMVAVAALAAPVAGRAAPAGSASGRTARRGAGAGARRDPLREPFRDRCALPDDPAISAQRARLQRMHACAHEWHARKRAGKTEGQGWRAFNGALHGRATEGSGELLLEARVAFCVAQPLVEAMRVGAAQLMSAPSPPPRGRARPLRRRLPCAPPGRGCACHRHLHGAQHGVQHAPPRQAGHQAQQKAADDRAVELGDVEPVVRVSVERGEGRDVGRRGLRRPASP